MSGFLIDFSGSILRLLRATLSHNPKLVSLHGTRRQRNPFPSWTFSFPLLQWKRTYSTLLSESYPGSRKVRP
jgi:hypothetical protein